jgi:inorganic pyrophosphatase
LVSLKKKAYSSIAMQPTDTRKDFPLVEVVIEIPRGSFLKRGSTGVLDFISPVPCPFNYGSVPAFGGLDGDLLDAVVLGPRLSPGTTINVYAWRAIGMIDQGLHDDKLICSCTPIPHWKQKLILLFFILYAKAKRLINLTRGNTGVSRCEGWLDAEIALSRAAPRANGERKEPTLHF